jgi:hypothetical protein
MNKYKITAQYYRVKDNAFTAGYEYYVETEYVIKEDDYIAIIDPDIQDVRCVLVTDVTKLKKSDTCLRKKTVIGIVHTTYFADVKREEKRRDLLSRLETRSAQASKMKLYETLAQTDNEMAVLLQELKELDKE